MNKIEQPLKKCADKERRGIFPERMRATLDVCEILCQVGRGKVWSPSWTEDDLSHKGEQTQGSGTGSMPETDR